MGMSKEKLQPKRDTIGVRMASEPEHPLEQKLSANERQLLDLITRLTKLDNEIRIKKFEAINSKKAAKRLADELKADSNVDSHEDDLPLMAKSDISIGTQIDLLCMTEWIKTLPIFNELPLPNRLYLIKKFAPRHLTLENGFFTTLHSKRKENIYQICTGGYMPREISMIKDKVKGSVRY
jgi:hypothetical protein